MTIRKPFCVKPLELVGVVAGNARSNRSASNIGRPQFVGMRWETDGNSNVWARGQFDGTKTVDFCSLMQANAQAGTTIRLRLGDTQAEVDGTAPYDSGAVTFINPAATRSDGFYHSHLEISTPVEASWWRIDIGSHTGDFSASALVMGEKLEPARFYNRDREIGREDLGSLDFSRNGVPAETPGTVLRTLLFRLQWVSNEEFFSKWDPLTAEKGQRQILFWCFDPQSSVRRHDQTFLGYLARDPFMRGNTFPKDNELDMQLRAIL